MKPILFNTEMARAILDGRKTVTRRAIKDRDIINGWDCEADGTPIAYIDRETGDCYPPTHPCRYQPGDILYVRETWVKLYYVDPNGYTHFDKPMYYYAADGTPDICLRDGDGFELDDQRIRWHPSIHMPKEAARLFLRLKNVRAERLQNIDHDGCRSEGVSEWCITPLGGFVSLWNSTIKKDEFSTYGWGANPWVWVIEFERVTKEEAEHESE